jgi:hypothetical protein
MQKKLDKIHTYVFEKLDDNRVEHDRLLSRIELAKKVLSNGDYKEKHSSISLRIATFTKDFISFKRIVFDYAKTQYIRIFMKKISYTFNY